MERQSRVKEIKKTKKNKAIFNIQQLATLLVLTSIFSIIMGVVVGSSNNKLGIVKDNDAFSSFIVEYNKIKENYYEDLDDKEMMKKAIEHIVASLDANSVVIDDNLSNTLTTQLQGSFEGFGIEISNEIKTNDIVVVNVLEDTPASRAGLKSMDKIKMIDDKNVEGMDTIEFINMVKSSTASKFVLTIIRGDEELKLDITREKVVLTSVASEIYERNNKKIGYIYVSLFAYNTDEQFAKALTELEKEGIDALIVDLRYNTGGHLTAVENMMSEFLDKTHVIYQVQTKKETKKYYSKTDVSRNYDMVVLVNEYSASASEMFTAAMKEEYGATIIGTTTFGKGTVQEVQNSVSGDFQYKLTTKKWLTPKGNWINEKGIEPDIVVELNEENLNEDIQLEKALEEIVKRH